MPTTVKDMIALANQSVPKVSIEETRELIAKGQAVVVDVRDAPEIGASGKIAGALHVSRGMLEFRADPQSPFHDDRLTPKTTIIVYCASGGRSALAGKALVELGYLDVRNLGGFKDWVEAGGEIEKPIEPGM